MNCRDLFRIVISKVTCRISSPISSGSNKFRISQNLLHQLMNENSSAPYAHPGSTRSLRITVAWKRWDHDIKTVAGVTAIGTGIRQLWNDFKHLHERAWPPMNEDQRNRMRSLSFLVNNVKFLPAN